MIKVAMIGTGNISGAHLRYLKTRADVAIAGLADIKRANLVRRQTEFGGTPFADYRRMLDRIKPDAVWLCTPPGVRREPLLECAARGVPVFCEKPVERRVAAGAAIARALARRRARVQIGYVFRMTPIVARLREAMQDDRIHLVQSLYGCGVSLTRSLPAWFYDQAKSGGALADQATHNFDLLRHLFGEVEAVWGAAHNPVRPRRGRYTIDETLGVLFRFASGILGTHLHTWVGDGWRNEIVISGEKRLYRLLLSQGCLVIEDPNARSARDPLDNRPGPAGRAGPLRFEQDPRPIFAYEDDRFLAQVVSGDWSANPCTYADGLETLRLTTACQRALRRRGAGRA